MTPLGFFISFLVFSGIQDTGLSLIRKQRDSDLPPLDEGLDETYTEDVKRQLLKGIKDVRKLAEKVVELNTKAGDLASQLATQATTMRKTLDVDEIGYRSGSDSAVTNATTAQSDVTLSQIDAQINFKLFSARRDFAWAKKIGERTVKMLQVFSKEGADPVKNRYYEERGGSQRQAIQYLSNYQVSLQKMRIALMKLRNLETSFKDATDKDFSTIPDWKTDGSVAMKLVRSLKTDIFLKAYKETEKTDYYIENSEKASESDSPFQRSCRYGGCQGKPYGTKFGNLDGSTYGIGLGSDFEELPIKEITKEAAKAFQSLTAGKSRSISFIKCLVTNIITFLSELYTCVQGGGGGGEEPEPEVTPEPSDFYLPYRVKYNPKYAVTRSLFCAIRPMFYFILGSLTCLLI